MKHSAIKDCLQLKKKYDEEVTICGWVRTRRDSKKFSFIELNDGTCFASIQVIADAEIETYQNVLDASTGSSLQVTGILKESPGKGQKVEVHAQKVELLGIADSDYPLQKKRHSREFLRTIAHLRTRTNTFGAVFRVRHAASFAVNQFFNERGFVYLHTPIITASDCEGAGQMFRVSTLDALKPPLNDEKQVDYTQDFFGEETSLTVSGQLEAELFASALSKVYTFGPTFRAENSNTPRHLAEFWMIEPEMAFCDLQGNMDLAEEFIRYVITYILENCKEDMEFFNKWVEKGIIDSLQDLCKSDFERITYTEAIKALENAKKSFEYPVKWGMDIQTEHERYLTEEYLKKPVFVTDYPRDIKAFYMRVNDDEKTVAAMDLLVPRLGEIIGGSQREERLDVLKKNMEKHELDEATYSWYLDIRRYGTTPHAGFGLGFERLIMYLTGIENIRDVIPFPRTPGNAKF
ncbi:asparagine--tRNA ligase [Candidatus Uabimicrobium amorphum]|uniref:Asparagine--tRNA ligase n=1 Tax=Uabimicrobium amorphum TaxID=2596890 RepID=A0A5S9ITD9_UABAM|nr:asparagine--tRNA ligase [Candidatus Uabimicrobium amorphum]BBM87407.1 asparagine--tRNA ligase [Candidatus Uabimicrobium amorphum]